MPLNKETKPAPSSSSNFIFFYIVLRRHVPNGLAGCRSLRPSLSVKAGAHTWAVVSQRYLRLQISPTP